MGPYELDEDTRVDEIKPGVYAGRMTERWGIGAVPNGGYVLAVAMSAVRQALPAPDPLTVTAHYLRPGATGPVRVFVETIKLGRRYSSAMARLVQDAGEVIRVLATYGDLGEEHRPVHVVGRPPELPPPQALAPRAAEPSMPIVQRFDCRLDPATTAFLRGERTNEAEVRGWIRFADGRRPDVHALGLIADSFPPAVFQILEPGWVPTLELTVHVRARPTSEWLACVFRTRFVQGELLEEDGEIWDEGGRLVALSRQLATLPHAPQAPLAPRER